MLFKEQLSVKVATILVSGWWSLYTDAKKYLFILNLTFYTAVEIVIRSFS